MKKLIALALVSVMLFALVPFSAFAEDVVSNEVEEVADVDLVSGLVPCLDGDIELQMHEKSGAVENITDDVTEGDGWTDSYVINSAGTACNAYLTFPCIAEAVVTGASFVMYYDAESLSVPWSPVLQALVSGEWVTIGSFSITEPTETGFYTVDLVLEESVSTNRLMFQWWASGWCSIVEIDVYGSYVEGGMSAEKATRCKNLVLGSSVEMTNATEHSSNNNESYLTDSWISPENSWTVWNSGYWYGVRCTVSNTPVYATFEEFENPAEITDAKIIFSCDSGSGIGQPSGSWLEAKVDGEWVTVAYFDESAVADTIVDNKLYRYTLGESYLAEGTLVTQVRIAWYSIGWSWITEMTVCGIEGGSFEYELSDDNTHYSVTDYTGTETQIVIPSEYNGLPVKTIGYGIFDGNVSITSVTIPNSITSVENNAFYGCTNLTSVYISDLAAWCGIEFNFDSNPLQYGDLYLNGELVTELVIPDSVASIGKRAFEHCINLTSITIPKSVTAMGYGAFYGCTGLTSVYIEDLAAWCNIEFDLNSNPLQYGDLYLNGELVTDLIIPDTVTKIEANAFYGYTDLTSVTVPNSITTVKYNAFYGCTGLTSVYIDDLAAWCGTWFGPSANPLQYGDLYLDGELVTELVIPESVTSIGDSAFEGYDALTSVTISGSVTEIGDNSFDNCTGLTSVTILDSVTKIGSGAFMGCTGLTSVTLPDSLALIDEAAFVGCTNLTSVHISDLAAWCGIEFLDNPLYYAKNLYLNGELVTELVIPDSVTSIGTRAFYHCINLTSITIPKSVTAMGYDPFYGCTALTDIYCEALEQPSEWNSTWLSGCDATVHWGYKNGIVTESDGTLAYYVDDVKQSNLGLIEYEDNYYYVNSSGVVMTGKYWVTKDNGTGYAGMRYFDENGKMVIKDGIVTESDGTLAYYVGNVKQSDLGLITINANYYYVNSSGTVVTGEYWVTKDNGIGYTGMQYFDETGKYVVRKGIVTDPDGTLAYYVEGVKQYALGLIELDGYYYYVNSNGKVMTGQYWVSNDNGLGYAGMQNFDEYGRLIIE